MAHAETQKARKSRSRSHSAIGVTLDEGAWPKLAVREQLERFQQQKGEREIPGGLQATTDFLDPWLDDPCPDYDTEPVMAFSAT